MLWCALLAAGLLGAAADVVVMKDVTLGFGEALEHCREEVSSISVAIACINKVLTQP